MAADPELLSAFFLADEPRAVIAAAARVREVSRGEVRNSETHNRRTGKPERDGLYCAKLFGPVEDHRCLCGKLEGRDHAGARCERCGVECGEARVRGERWGHVSLPVPVVHPRLLPAVAAALAISVADLRRVFDCAAHLRDDGALAPGEPDDGSLVGLRIAELLAERAGELLVSDVPVTPPGWRGTRHDPQDLGYTALLHRRNRLARLQELDAPWIILANEARMLQEAFDRLVPAVRAELAAREPVVVAPVTPRARALLQAVYDDPDDDAAREAYAEHLHAAGDPRGRFILRQLDRGRVRPTRLEVDLLRRNYDRWVAPLAGAVADGVRFRRGFPSAVRTLPAAAGRLDEPAWATIERLDSELPALIAHPGLRALEHLSTSFRAMAAVCAGGASLPRVHTLRLTCSRLPPPGAELVTGGEALPGVRALTVVRRRGASPDEWSWLVDTPLVRTLERLTLDLSSDHLGDLDLPSWTAALPRLPQLSLLAIGYDRELLRFELRPDAAWCDLRVVLSRGVLERIALGDGELVEAMTARLTALAPHEVGNVRVVSPGWWGEDLERLAAALRAHFGGHLTLPRGA